MESLNRELEYAVDNIGLILKRGGIIDSNAAVLEVLGVVCAGDGAAGILILIGVVDIIDNIVLDITEFIEKNDYHLCDKETWFRPILFNIALEGMLYTLEQKI